jgi:hypothetical protein
MRLPKVQVRKPDEEAAGQFNGKKLMAVQLFSLNVLLEIITLLMPAM